MVLDYLLLMCGEPGDTTINWYAGLGLGILFMVVYLVEEAVGIAQHRGRPCAHCGQRIYLRPFTLRIRCPHCGGFLDMSDTRFRDPGDWGNNTEPVASAWPPTPAGCRGRSKPQAGSQPCRNFYDMTGQEVDLE